MVTLNDIETTQGEVPQVIEQWFADRGIGPLSSNRTIELMRHIERLEAQVKSSTWTTVKPTKPGWYWWRTRTRSGKWCKIRLEEVRSNMTVSGWGEIDKLDGEWSSEPIAEPEEAS